MKKQLLPAIIDNKFRGPKLALWFFWLVVIVRAMQGISLIVNGPGIVKDADGVPLETFSHPASQSIVAVFVISGFSRLVLSLLAVLVFIRYKSAIPLMLAVLALDQIGKEILLQVYPLYRVGNPMGPIINLVLMGLTLIGFALSLRKSLELAPAQ